MNFEWDTDKASDNQQRHGVAFDAAKEFDFKSALTVKDTRYDYGETRWRSLGMVGARLHVIVYTLREGTIRVISLRKANAREQKEYGNG
ncbi:MAG: BrnT family toxin [Pseudomonadota bacterium]